MTGLSRRQLLSGACAVAVTMVAGAGAGAAAAKPARPAMTMYRSPGCGCCLKWAKIARAAGYPVTVEETSDIIGLKASLGVPEALYSCHTTKASGYVVEGHVPFEAVAKLLRDKPKGVAGIAVPGMPAGSPGMEAHGDDASHSAHAIEVFAFTRSGASKAFAF